MTSVQKYSEIGKVLVALGTNLAPSGTDLTALARAAMAAVEAAFAVPVTWSRLYRTPAYPVGSGPDFLNAACCFNVDLTPVEILATLHRIEAEHGRVRDVRWGARTLDLDLISVASIVLPDATVHQKWRDLPIGDQQSLAPEELILPHPRVQDRAFVLGPLMDLAPHWRHPLLDQDVAEMWNALTPDQRAEIQPLE